MQAAQQNKDPFPAIAICDCIRPVGIRDIDLNGDNVGGVIQRQCLNMLIDNFRFILWRQIGGQGRQPQRRK